MILVVILSELSVTIENQILASKKPSLIIIKQCLEHYKKQIARAGAPVRRKRKLADVEIENLQGKRTKTHETRSKNTARKAATTLTERMDENLEHTSIQELDSNTLNTTPTN
ncbi:4903_t:CDS:2 [Ambispora leptoticha]|uniref:4903_t:CDS:1 n=1 Tax=Ambispora leptoticha TaxID=144679 RepID=A0A9N9GC35_9GLOM|nr:4903_t:CDS:2 [Ambispora leptoticha]